MYIPNLHTNRVPRKVQAFGKPHDVYIQVLQSIVDSACFKKLCKNALGKVRGQQLGYFLTYSTRPLE